MNDVRVAGGVLVGLGGLALWEGVRLLALRTEMLAGAVVGDDTLPIIVGVALLVIGAYLLVGPVQAVRPRFGTGGTGSRMAASAGVLVAYCAAMPHLGYTASTAVGAALLFRAMGAYRWPACLLLSAAVTGTLYLLFRVWLKQPLPIGLLGG